MAKYHFQSLGMFDAAHYKVGIVETDTGINHATIKVNKILAVEVVTELMTIYDVALKGRFEPSMTTKPGSEAFQAIEIQIDRASEQVACAIPDGDNPGNLLFGYGESICAAMADLLRSQDFKSKIVETGQVTAPDFIADLIYGVQRKSNDQLMLEMEAIISPEKGAW